MPGTENQTSRDEKDAANVSAAVASPEARDNGTGTRFTESDLPVFLPNAPSEPVWSLAVDATPPAIPKQHEAMKLADKVVSPRNSEPALRDREHAIADAPAAAPPVEQAPVEPAGPSKKGWWQRPFRDRG
jgi:hypothetical protein